jgi:hypothetical protein
MNVGERRQRRRTTILQLQGRLGAKLVRLPVICTGHVTIVVSNVSAKIGRTNWWEFVDISDDPDASGKLKIDSIVSSGLEEG